MATSDKSESTAIRMLASGNLHKSLWLPQTASHQRLRVTFATTSNFDNENLPVVLFIGPMFGTRYINLMFDKLARSEGLRVIAVDRPGVGGSTAVPVAQRMSVWLETVPVLLRHLNVEHVHLLTHSAGTLYTLNTLAHLREFLAPRMPHVAFIAPWVHSDQSGTFWKAAAVLPNGLISKLSDVTEFVQQSVMPAASWSGGILTSLSSIFQGTSDSSTEDAAEMQDKYGIDAETGKHLHQLQAKYTYAEGIKGGGDDTVLCLKKAGTGAWGACEDYMSCIRELARQEKAQQERTGARLRVRLHFASSDLLIGKGGKEYFEKCWQQETGAEVFDVVSKEWPETSHDSVLVDWSKGAMKSIFEDIKRVADGLDA